MAEDNILDRLAAEIRRLEKQRDETAVRIEQATQRIEKLEAYGGSLTAKSPLGSAMSGTEHEQANEADIREGATEELPRSAASKPSKIVEKAKTRLGKEKRASVQRRRYGYC